METMDSRAENCFATLSREEQIALFEKMLAEEPIESLRRTVDAIKVAFYRSPATEEAETPVAVATEVATAEVAEATEATEEVATEPATTENEVAAESTVATQQQSTPDQLESAFKALMAQYRTRRDAHIAEQEQQRELNLLAKQQIIEELKELVENDETQNHTFNKFRELQERWRNTGPVSATTVKDIWEQYNYQTERFYGVIKINRELRDLDQRKNLEAKEALCERAEALTQMENVIEAFRELQTLHDQWREVGPVDAESKETIWLRFKEATSTINKRHAGHFDALREEQESNLKRKADLCQRVEEMVASAPTSHNGWSKCSDDLMQMQQEWRTIGFAPKRDNTTIYNRFRAACDAFFVAKRVFYAASKDEHSQNMTAKIALCESAEALAQSDDWKGAGDQLIKLQAEWKSIGAVARRDSDKVWKRFRSACDTFFERKAAHFATENNDQQSNLTLKEELLTQMQSVLDGGKIESIDVIKTFQRRWSEIGFVPIKSKESLQSKHKAIIDQMFNLLRSEESSRAMGAYRNHLDNIKGSKGRGGRNVVSNERDKVSSKLKQLKLDIIQLENNLGFFAKSKGAEAMIADVERKIEAGKREIEQLKEKIKLIDLAARTEE